jgi:hypothetical protein
MFFRGVIYYTPDTPYTNEIMEKVEEKFLEFKNMDTVVNSVVSIIHRVRKWLRSHSEEITDTLVAKKCRLKYILQPFNFYITSEKMTMFVLRLIRQS